MEYTPQEAYRTVPPHSPGRPRPTPRPRRLQADVNNLTTALVNLRVSAEVDSPHEDGVDVAMLDV